MADLTAIAGGVQVVTTPPKRRSNRARKVNPFDALLTKSLNTAWTDSTGKQHEHGEPVITPPLHDEDTVKEVLSAIRASAKYLDLRHKTEIVETDADGKRFPFGRKAVKFAAYPQPAENSTEPEGNGEGEGNGEDNGEGEGEQGEGNPRDDNDVYEGEGEPANV